MQIDRMVIGVDFSAPALAAAKWGAEQLAPNAELILVHAIDLPTPPPFAPSLLPDAETRASAERVLAEKRLAELASSFTAVTVQREVRVGRAHEVISAVAAEKRADIAVVGPHSDSAHRWKMLGTTAERLVRTSAVPVLVATNPGSAPPRKLLAAIDGSEVTKRILQWARDLADGFDGALTVLHVWSTAAMSHVMSLAAAAPNAGNDEELTQRADEEMRADARHWLADVVADIGRERVSATVTYGKAGDAILATAATMSADLIVLGRRGTGQILPALLGSTVNTVLHGAVCPVLVVTD